MKRLVILVCTALAAAAPPAQRAASNSDEFQLVQFKSDNDGQGNFNDSFEQNDGTKIEERGELRNAGGKDEFVAVQGSYGSVGPDDVYHMVSYIADDKDVQPTIEQVPGAPLPVGVLEALLKQ